ncbi:unnamed protein product [Somion occarium]|uniref:Uncharacterized protein n=1 Tax=Somion occarium TaxID=3059160 RepID=A0ABP1DL65_9APHY
MLRCEMSSNSLTALVRAFPLLIRVGFASVDFSAQNSTIIREESLPPKPSSRREGSGTDIPDSETVSVNEPSVRPTPHDALGIPLSSHDHPTLPVQYPLLHPPPSLQSFTVNNLCTDFFEFDFLLLRDWFRPEMLTKSLKSLDVSSWVDDLTLAKFITSLGTSPALECLTLWVGWGLRYYMRSTVDIHHLTNLTSIRLVTERTLERDEVDAMQYVLSQLNAPRLQVISISIPAIRTFKVLEGMDEYLAKEFGGIKKLCVETYTDGPEEEKKAREEVTAMFPLMAERGVLRVEDRDIPYLL